MKGMKTVQSKKKVNPTVYAYTLPGYAPKQGWVKVGYTERSADVRIKEQSHTVGVIVKKLWEHEARFNGGGYFTDHGFHEYLAHHGIEREPGTEWFYFGDGNEQLAEDLYMKYTFNKYGDTQKALRKRYVLRNEQAEAVQLTLDYASTYPESEFLWNAKPRFGKTLSSYDLVRKMDAVNVLIVTNRPAIANAWFDDFKQFIAWQTDYKFVSDSESLKDRSPLSREEWLKHATNEPDARQINFVSLQDLKGSKYHGGAYDKLKYISGTEWDVLIIDEAHEGIDTLKTDVAFDEIKRHFTLHLSGTPFKAIASGDFSEEQIFNWSYEDEQAIKERLADKDGRNPYAELPKLNMYTYQMSRMLQKEVKKGITIDEKEREYAFDLNEFFKVEDGKLVYEKDVKKWLDTLTSNEKYPFSTRELRNELKHTFWLLNRVDSVKALAKLLNQHPVFENYEVIIAAGDGKSEDDMKTNEKSLDRVKKAIKSSDKTITLSVGQLTTGVTIPEWSAVLMLSNIQSSALYMQAAFRSQNPHKWSETEEGRTVVYQKQNAYVFDFAPERTLILFDEFANNLNAGTSTGGGTTHEREERIKRLLNFFPVIGEDTDGEMKELDYNDVITMPKAIKANEVVSRGFMSNFLFANISNIFGAPQVVLDTIGNLEREEQGKTKRTNKKVDTKGVDVDENGDAQVDEPTVIEQTEKVLGDKLYKVDTSDIDLSDTSSDNVSPTSRIMRQSKQHVAEVTDKVKSERDLTVKEAKRYAKEVSDAIEQKVTECADKHRITKAHLDSDFNDGSLTETEYEEEIQSIDDQFRAELEDLPKEVITDTTLGYIEKAERKAAEKKKTSVEDDIRSHLRGFSRTIPSFLMAYGDDALSLANFETFVDAKVFKEVTDITIDQFIFLRDGGDYEEDGKTKHFKGQLFDDVVFNESIKEFLNKRKELANYFEDTKEDIFDYIPPQKTNQIFTPKHVVKMMVDALEKENPDIFDDSSKTFCDLYMKSGLYITEIVKRLYNSKVIQKEFPDDKQRIKHILENQVYGFAPSEIIYRIATTFIFGELDADISRNNFKAIDTAPYAKEGTMQELIDREFGE